jgi:uncharacterized spore protein YtfJ
MSDETDKVLDSVIKSQAQNLELMEKLFAVAQPGAVYGEPVASGEYAVITASEILVAAGSGYGVGGGTGAETLEEETAVEGEEDEGTGFGGGGAGGGVSMGRPVATINIGPNGVQVQPVVDVTKIGLAFFTTIGAMLMMLGRMRRASGG